MPVDASDHDESVAPDGTPLWKLSHHPGTNKVFGQVGRIAAYLWFSKEVGDTFTMRELRTTLGEDLDGKAEHLNRRLRELRDAGWLLASYKDDRQLPPDTYRVEEKGARLWIEEERRAQQVFRPSQRVRRVVMDRDGSRCRVCGVGRGESYPGEPGSKAVLTIGHRVPQERLRSRGDADDLDNWRTECARCNETVRNQLPDPERYDELLAEIRQLKTAELRQLLTWLRAGERTRSRLDHAYDRARNLSHGEHEQLISHVTNVLGDS
jgi:hypothetical protein